jgi:hypothetical protein
MAPTGGVVRAQGGVVEVDTAAELLVEVEVLVVDEEVEVGAAEEVLVGDTDEVVLVGAAEDVVDVAVLIQEQALETLDGRFEQADAQAGSVAEAGPVV